jgi:hypothetical protein
MLNVTFVGPGGTIGTVSMDVPRIGEQVAILGGGFTVTAVRYYVNPGSASAAVLLTPVAADSVASEHDQQLPLAAPKNSKTKTARKQHKKAHR